MMKRRCFLPGILLTALVNAGFAQEINYDEEKAGTYTLPEVLTCGDGSVVSSPDEWREKRRPELLRAFEKYEYGKAPARPALAFRVLEEAVPALDGKALRKQVRIFLTGREEGPGMNLLIYFPPGASNTPAPAFLGLNFQGNHSVSRDPGILLGDGWVANGRGSGPQNNRASEESRGSQAPHWQVEQVMAAGYALATACYGDIDPDVDDGFGNGVHALFPEIERNRDGETWGSISAWAWGLSLAMDYLEKEPLVDPKRVVVHGFSRLGKTSLWAGAQDERFAAVIAHQSGCGGAALHRRIYGETVARINRSFPHWFCRNFRGYNDNESSLPVDQHQLIALVAPRPMLVCSAEEDRWADPKGEFLGAWHATPVWKLYGRPVPATDTWPQEFRPSDSVAYFLRPGPHAVTADDWKAWIAFADAHLKR